jgi:hypothetical protein
MIRFRSVLLPALCVFLAGCAANQFSQFSPDTGTPKVTTEGHIVFPETPIYAEFRNSPSLTARLRAHLDVQSFSVLETPQPDAPRLVVYGYYASRDRPNPLGKIGVVDFGRFYEALLNGTADQVERVTAADLTRTSVNVADQVSAAMSSNFGTYLVSSTLAKLFTTSIGNALETPEEGAADAYYRRRFLAENGVNSPQLWAVLFPAGASPALPENHGNNVVRDNNMVRVTIRYNGIPADPFSLAIETLLPALTEGATSSVLQSGEETLPQPK